MHFENRINSVGCPVLSESYKKTETKSGTLVMALLLTSCPLNTSLESLCSLPPPPRSQLLWYSPPSLSVTFMCFGGDVKGRVSGDVLYLTHDALGRSLRRVVVLIPVRFSYCFSAFSRFKSISCCPHQILTQVGGV